MIKSSTTPPAPSKAPFPHDEEDNDDDDEEGYDSGDYGGWTFQYFVLGLKNIFDLGDRVTPC